MREGTELSEGQVKVNPKIKVCHLSSAHRNTDRRIFEAECTSLAKAGYEVYLIGQGKSRIQNDVKVIGLKKSKNRVDRMVRLTRYVYRKALSLDCDVYHLHDPELLLYALKLKKHGKKVIFDSHEFYTAQIPEKKYLPKPFMKIFGKIYGIYEGYILKRIDGAICPCTIQGENPFEGKCKYTALVNNTPVLGEFYEKYDPSVKKIGSSICCIGNLSYARGITNLIKAAYMADARLYLGGMFCSDDYKRSVESMPEYSCVTYLGYLDRNQVRQTLSQCSVCVSNTLNIGQYNHCDNLPTKVYESMAFGIPVIISDSPYVREVMSKYPFGKVIDPMDIEGTANAIRYVLDHPDRAKEMGEEGRRAIKEMLNWSVDEEQLLKLYEGVADDVL